MNLINAALDLVAPKAKVSTTVELPFEFAALVNHLEKDHKLKIKDHKEARLRVDGNFFADLRATKVMLGMDANPKHYMKVGFDLLVREMGGNQFTLYAEERVILGWLEKKAVSKSLEILLDNLVGELSDNSV